MYFIYVLAFERPRQSKSQEKILQNTIKYNWYRRDADCTLMSQSRDHFSKVATSAHSPENRHHHFGLAFKQFSVGGIHGWKMLTSSFREGEPKPEKHPPAIGSFENIPIFFCIQICHLQCIMFFSKGCLSSVSNCFLNACKWLVA